MHACLPSVDCRRQGLELRSLPWVLFHSLSLLPPQWDQRGLSKTQTWPDNFHHFPSSCQAYWDIKIIRTCYLTHSLVPSTLDSPNQNFWSWELASVFFWKLSQGVRCNWSSFWESLATRYFRHKVFKTGSLVMIYVISSDTASWRNRPTLPSAAPLEQTSPVTVYPPYSVQMFYHIVIQNLSLKSVYKSAMVSLHPPALALLLLSNCEVLGDHRSS